MNAQPRFVRHFCAVCWEPFYLPTAKNQGLHLRCEKCRDFTDAKVNAMPVPVSGVAIRRNCIGCSRPFVARDEAAVYCDLYCYARHNCHFKVVGNSKRR